MEKKASLLTRRMAPPTLTPTPHPQIPERRHSDPPALWVSVIVGSIVIHLFAFWMLRLLLMGRLQSWQIGKTLIPVELVAVASNTTSSAKLPQTPRSAATRNPASGNTRTRRTSNQRPNRQTSSVATSSSTRPDSQQRRPQQPEAKLAPSPTGRESPASNSSQNQQPAKPKPSTKPTPSGDTTNPSDSGTSSSNSNSSTASSTENTPSNTQPGGGFIALPGVPILGNNTRDVIHADDPNYNDRLATIKQSNSQFSSDDLASLGITLKSDLELKVAVVIEETGGATLLPDSTQVLRGDISADKAEQLAAKIIQQWKFNPTLMAGQPVSRDYSLQLTIRPNQK